MHPLTTYAAALCLLVATILFRLYKQRVALTRKLEHYGNRAQDIYVYSEFPEDDEVYQRAVEEREWLRKAQNELGVTVHELYYQDGARQGASHETWTDFNEYVANYILEEDEAREKWLNSQGRDWYLKHVKRQQGVVLKTEAA